MAQRVQVLVQNSDIKATPAMNVIHGYDIIPYLFSVRAVQSRLQFQQSAVNGNIYKKRMTIAIVQIRVSLTPEGGQINIFIIVLIKIKCYF